MRGSRAFWLSLAVALGFSQAHAHSDLGDASFARAMYVVLTFDHLVEGCSGRGGFAPDDLRTVREWKSRNQVAVIRARINEISLDARTLARIDELRASIRSQLQSGYLERRCTAAVAAVKLDDAQIARNSPELLARLCGAGAYAAAGDTSTASATIAPSRRGRYQIDGITFVISYDDGSTESRILVTDPKDANSAIWLDGAGYVRR